MQKPSRVDKENGSKTARQEGGRRRLHRRAGVDRHTMVLQCAARRLHGSSSVANTPWPLEPQSAHARALLRNIVDTLGRGALSYQTIAYPAWN